MEQFFSIIIPKRKLRLLSEKGLICHCSGSLRQDKLIGRHQQIKTRPPLLKLPHQPHGKRLALINNSRPNTCFIISLSLKPALKRASKWNLAVAETNLNKSLLFIT